MIAPVISLTVVLPLLPVMPITMPSNSRRQPRANLDSADERVRHDDLRQRDVEPDG